MVSVETSSKGAVEGDARLVALIVTRLTILAYPELLPELVGELQRRGLRAVLEMIETEGEADRAIEDARRLDVAGVIVAVRPSEPEVLRIGRKRLPMLLYNCHAKGPTVDSVSCDHAACGRTLASLLLDAGHRRFGLIASSKASLVSSERIAGAETTLRSNRALAIEVVRGDFSYQSGIAALDTLFDRMKPRPSAIIAANDAMALGALDRARELRVRVPRDLSVVGIDGTATAALPMYRLTTMRQPLRVLAAAAADQLLARINDPEKEIESRLFSGELVLGTTARLERPQRNVALS